MNEPEKPFDKGKYDILFKREKLVWSVSLSYLYLSLFPDTNDEDPNSYDDGYIDVLDYSIDELFYEDTSNDGSTNASHDEPNDEFADEGKLMRHFLCATNWFSLHLFSWYKYSYYVALSIQPISRSRIPKNTN